MIGGYRLGGDPFDALIVGYYRDGKLYYAEKVKNGFVPRLRRDVFKRFSGLETNVCPFVNLPEKRKGPHSLTREDMEKCGGSSPKWWRKSNLLNGRRMVTCAIRNSSGCATTKTLVTLFGRGEQ